MRIANSKTSNRFPQGIRQSRRKIFAGEIQVGVEQRKCTALFRECNRRGIRRIAQTRRNFCRHLARRGFVVAQSQHRQRIAKSRKAQADAALGACLCVLRSKWPLGHIERVIEHAHRDRGDLGEGVEIKTRISTERCRDKLRQIDRSQAATAIRWQRLLATRIGGGDGFAIIEIVVAVDAIQEKDARLGVVVGRVHDVGPQFARRWFPVHPHAVLSLVGTGIDDVLGGFRAVDELDRLVLLQGAHERIGDCDRNVEIA